LKLQPFLARSIVLRIGLLPPETKQIPARDRPSERLGSSINDDIVYEVRTTEVFKGGDEPGVEYDVSMTFDLATGGNSAL